MREIRLRVGVAVILEGRILLVPHYNTDAGPVQWVIPGGRVEYGETLEAAAIREFKEETGLIVRITGLVDVSQVIIPERDWHSVTITFAGEITGGKPMPEEEHRFGTKMPRWLSEEEVRSDEVHPRKTILKAFSSLNQGI
jgi:ADP-ribose pyrophosphatase YjhB (NUDIX family)